MEIIKQSVLWLYFHLFNFLAKERLRKKDTEAREMHAHFAMVLSTSFLMWSYVILACFTVDSPTFISIGLICSCVHLFSLFLFRFSNNVCVVSDVAIGAGLVQTIGFAFYTAGYMSFALKWFAILPMLSGMVCGRSGAIRWAFITAFVTLVFLFLHLINFPFPNTISEVGRVWGNSLLLFGWILMGTVMILVHVSMRERSEKLLKEQGQKIDDLFRVLFHDLANSLGRISIGLSIARKQENSPQTKRGIEIASEAANSMLEITQNVRKMYAVSKGKAEVDLAPTSLNDCVKYLQNVFSGELEKKNVHLEYDFEANQNCWVLVEPISFKNQVLGNIISNAIKFSHQGGKICMKAYPVNYTYHMIEIKDEGIGMPHTLISHMFDMTKKTSRPGTEGEQGTGFGMHIMKSFVEMYQGQVMIDSEEAAEGKTETGTTFKLILKAASHK